MKYKDVGSRKYFDEHVGKEAMTFLLNLCHFNLDSRLHVATGIFNALYKPLQSRTGDLANLDDSARRQLLDLVSLEILSKTFMALEDLGKVLLSGGKSPKDFPQIVLDCAQGDSLKAIAQLAAVAPLELAKVVPFIHPREYGLTGEEEVAVQRYNFSNLEALRGRLVFLSKLIERHSWGYNKYKHGIPIMLGMQGGAVSKQVGVDGAVPVIVARDRVEIMLSGSGIVSKFLEVLNLTVQISKSLLERRIQTVQLGGKPPLPLCHTRKVGNREQWIPWAFVDPSPSDRSILNGVFQRSLGASSSTQIEATFRVNIDHNKLQQLVDFYFRDWNLGQS